MTHRFWPRCPISRANPNKQGFVPHSPHSAYNAQHETEAILKELSSPLISANVGERGEELVEKVAVSAVEL